MEHLVRLPGLESLILWQTRITDAGLEPKTLPYEHSEFDPAKPREMFAGIKP